MLSGAVGAMGGAAMPRPTSWHRGSGSLFGSSAVSVRGGGTAVEVGPTVKVTVLTVAGSPHLDLKARLELPLIATVGELKAAIAAKMKGQPPAARQRLVLGPLLLADDAQTLSSLLAPAPAAERDEFDDDDAGGGVSDSGAGVAARELSVVLDMLPPLPVDKSPPAALDAKLKVWGAAQIHRK